MTKIEDTERYSFLMEESIRLYPSACQWLVHCAVCEQILEEQGIEIDENEVEQMKNLYCTKLEYDNMITGSTAVTTVTAVTVNEIDEIIQNVESITVN